MYSLALPLRADTRTRRHTGNALTRLARAAAVLTVLLPAVAAAQTTIAASDFEHGTDNWWVAGDPASPVPQWVQDGGNPDGRIRTTEVRHGVALFFVAPAKFLGDRSAAYGGTLSFDLQRQRQSAGPHYDDVVLVGGGGRRLVLDAGGDPDQAPAWTSYSVALTETAGWRVGSPAGPPALADEFKQVLASLSSIQIRAEFSGDRVDATGLDNVVLTGPVRSIRQDPGPLLVPPPVSQTPSPVASPSPVYCGVGTAFAAPFLMLTWTTMRRRPGCQRRRLGLVMLIGLVSASLWSRGALAGIVGVNGDALVVLPPRDLTAGGDNTGTEIWVLEEQQGMSLTQDVVVQASEPGYYDDSAQLSSRVVAAGTSLNSHYVYARKEGPEVAHDGAIVFDGRILGVIVLPPPLTAGSNFLGAGGVQYPTSTTYRALGLELDASPNEDTFTIHADRRTLTVHLMCGTPGDRIRVLTSPSPEGDLNCDEGVDAADVAPFVLALLDPAGYAAAYPACPIDLADINLDGRVDALDVQPFVELLVEP